MQDRECGVVWEETIIFPPSATEMIILSATLFMLWLLAEAGARH